MVAELIINTYSTLVATHLLISEISHFKTRILSYYNTCQPALTQAQMQTQKQTNKQTQTLALTNTNRTYTNRDSNPSNFLSHSPIAVLHR